MPDHFAVTTADPRFNFSQPITVNGFDFVSADSLRDAIDTLEKLRADLAEDDAETHAQRIAVLDLSISDARRNIDAGAA